MTERKKFWIKLSSWLVVAYIIPAAFIAWRFHLFQKVDRVSVGGWGLVFIIFTTIVISYILNQLKTGMKPGMAKQVINGILRVTLPLLTATLIIYWLDGVMADFLQVMITLTVCETVAIPLNPFPEWRRNNNLDEDAFSFEAFVKFLRKGGKK